VSNMGYTFSFISSRVRAWKTVQIRYRKVQRYGNHNFMDNHKVLCVVISYIIGAIIAIIRLLGLQTTSSSSHLYRQKIQN
jgi:hypothetical protein